MREKFKLKKKDYYFLQSKKLKSLYFLFRLEKDKQLIKSQVDEAKLQTENVNKAKVFFH